MAKRKTKNSNATGESTDAAADNRRMTIGFPKSNEDTREFYAVMMEGRGESENANSFVRAFIVLGWWHLTTQMAQPARDAMLMQLGVLRETRLQLEQYLSGNISFDMFLSCIENGAPIPAMVAPPAATHAPTELTDHRAPSRGDEGIALSTDVFAVTDNVQSGSESMVANNGQGVRALTTDPALNKPTVLPAPIKGLNLPGIG